MGVELRNVSGLAPPPGYSHVAIARGTTLVFMAGAVPLDAAGELVGAGDAAAQTDQVVAVLDG
jgi:enamine deaminase RidA (YjgF/YER057c/UK114 family)